MEDMDDRLNLRWSVVLYITNHQLPITSFPRLIYDRYYLRWHRTAMNENRQWLRRYACSHRPINRSTRLRRTAINEHDASTVLLQDERRHVRTRGLDNKAWGQAFLEGGVV